MAIVLCALFWSAQLAATPVTALAYSNYSPGTGSTTYQTPQAALGALNGNTSDGVGTAYALNPFNPAWKPVDIGIVGAGGSLTLQLSQNIQTTGQTLGVYSNVGYSGSGTSNSGPSTLGQVSQAVVSVSQDGSNWVTLNGGSPIAFNIPTNYYTDVAFSNPQPLGTVAASQSKPFLGTSAQLANSTYSQIVSAFNGSAGGTWLDLSHTGLPSVNYVRFNVPTGQRMVVDAVGGLGAANTLTAGSSIVSESVGTGSNTSHVIVDFGNQHSYQFDVHYNGSITGEQAMNLIQSNSDLRFSVTSYSFGDLLTSIDYGGYVASNASDFSNYWGYFNSSDGTNWNSYAVGFSDSALTNGSYDGWLFGDGDPAAVPSTPVAMPEPTGLLSLLAAPLLLLKRRGRRAY